MARVHGAQTIALAPLSDSETAALVCRAARVGPLGGWAGQPLIAEKAAGNPFFAEEMVRDLAERGVLRGNRSAIPVDGRCWRGQCASHLAGDHRRSHRPPRPGGQAHLERSGGDRLTSSAGACSKRWGLILSLRTWWAAAHRSDPIHPTTRVSVSPSADSDGGLRITAQVGSRRAAPARRGGNRISVTRQRRRRTPR